MTRSSASDPKVDLHFWDPFDAYSYAGASFGADPKGHVGENRTHVSLARPAWSVRCASARPPRMPKAARDGQRRAALVFRDFVRQLEKLDAKPPKPARGAAR
jgi:hypothetical protein